jgi:hypothetical protein
MDRVRGRPMQSSISSSEVMIVFSTRWNRMAGHVVLGFLLVGMFLVGSPAHQGSAEEDLLWDQIVQKISLMELEFVRDAAMLLIGGSDEAAALLSDPMAFIQSKYRLVETLDRVIIIDMVSNRALTPGLGRDLAEEDRVSAFATPATPDYVLSEAAFAITGPERGLLIRRRLPVDRGVMSFAEEVERLTVWIEPVLDYISKVIGCLEGEQDSDRVDRFLNDPADFLVQEAVQDGELGGKYMSCVSFLEHAQLVSYDRLRGESSEDPMFIPDGLLSAPGTVVIAAGYVDELWSIVVQLAQISFEAGAQCF